ncbi:branched-chain amino acid ABC transporter permease [Nocardioides sp. CER19]|uniref:branched-chain amino acid ABC transporter permease n=1 Tax=Nocardioides sp. CER19 TaxID=3038538 RepID=UPI00244BC55B|nr:branched-chain amino acid ABC transporter permease [Nocardioides sp. CER19]MDH2416308.1 branched-chain amino acid ABC transporter permease [Nocardioides sp. CER19]
MSLTDTLTSRAAKAASVRRSTRSTRVGGGVLTLVVLILAVLPFAVFSSVTDSLVNLFILIALASMWNLLAGFAGLVSVGQQAYFGLGAYAVLVFAEQGVQAYLAIILAAITAAVFAVPTSWLAFRLRGDYFAIGTWVIAEVYRLVTTRIDRLGGASGKSLTTLSDIDPVTRGALNYWVALVVAVASVVACYLLLRSRLGLALMAVRDEETAANAVGINVPRAKRWVYLISAAGCGAAGGVLLVTSLSVNPNAVYSVQWSAYMIFIVVIGGIGYIEGPLLGAVIFFALQQALADYGTTYLILLGLCGIAVALFAPRGLWGMIADRTRISLFPVGYNLAAPAGSDEPSTGEDQTR